MWLCDCSCGTSKEVRSDHLLHNRVTSCGCRQRELAATRVAANNATRSEPAGRTSGEPASRGKTATNNKPVKTHGMSRTAVYWAYKTMKDRCYNPNLESYPRYGGRGICVADVWRGKGGFERFFADMGPRPGPGYSIDRIANDGPYAPDNCRWASVREQARNKRNNRYVDYRGERRLLMDVAAECGVPYKELHRRIRRGWDVERATTTPVNPAWAAGKARKKK